MRRIDRLCRKYGVNTVIELETMCCNADQFRMRERAWDYNFYSLDTEIVTDLKRIPRAELTPDELWRVEQRIWMWYHHAVSCAIYKYKDKWKALYYVRKALCYQARIPNHPNKITKLFFLLLKGRWTKAKELVGVMCGVERKTALELIRGWERQSPFTLLS